MRDGEHADSVVGQSTPWRQEAYRRGVFCLEVFVITFTLVSDHAPIVISLQGVAFEYMHFMWAMSLPLGGYHLINGHMLAPTLLVAVIITLPAFVYHALALATRTPPDSRQLVRSALAVNAAFWMGLTFAYFFVLPQAVWHISRFASRNMPDPMLRDYYLYAALAVLLGVSLVFAAPLLAVLLYRARRAQG